ncbi:MAG: response regulator [Campylobacteraceae bacterium]|jgi:two-component system chemotaxis sensor kinase CheA|nr:response regulator [Campylobacteraceae bacterium]
MDELQEILQDFLIEAFEMIEQLDQDLVELEQRPEDLDLLNRIFRVAHTIKGSSSFLNFDVLTKLTHHMEDVLNKARHGELKITPEIMDIVLASIDQMKALLYSIRDTGSDATSGIDINPTVAKLDAASSGKAIEEAAPAASAPEPVATEPTPAEDEPDYSNMSAEEVEKEIERLLKQRQEEDERRRQEKKAKGEASSAIEAPHEPSEEAATKEPKPAAQPTPAPAPKPATPAPAAANPAPAAGGEGGGSAIEQTIRVDVNRLDHLMNLIGELVLGKNRLIKIYNDVEERYEGEQFLDELNQVVSSVSTVTTDLQIAVMKTRMLPIGRVFNRFPRMIRDLSRELNKKVELVMSGEETELDKSIVEEIGDPLVHIIRNSADHGIEMPDVRVAAGKSETGTVELKAYHEGNSIVIEITDDGKGLDPIMLKSKAVEKGVISEKEADAMSDKEAYGLIFKPGFSTAAKITNVSGRGVGMDVVKTNIEKLNGIIEVDSSVGKGTTIKLKIPLTLAIIQALLVGVQEEFFAIPLSSVLETVRITQDDIFLVEGKSVLRLRNEVLSLVKLSDIFGIETTMEGGDNLYVVIIGLADAKIGVVIDRLIGQEEIVIKSLGYYLKGIEGIAGATIRGDGKVTLIADVAALMQMAKTAHKKVDTSKKDAAIAQQAAAKKTQPSDYKILIVDDSKTDRSIMKNSIKPLGVTVLEAADGVEALNMIKNSDHPFDACLIDIEMPKMDGYTLASEIRKYNKYRNMPLIAVTSRTGKTDRMRGVEVGMSEYITKPYSPDYLMNVVKRHINLTVEG